MQTGAQYVVDDVVYVRSRDEHKRPIEREALYVCYCRKKKLDNEGNVVYRYRLNTLPTTDKKRKPVKNGREKYFDEQDLNYYTYV